MSDDRLLFPALSKENYNPGKTTTIHYYHQLSCTLSKYFDKIKQTWVITINYENHLGLLQIMLWKKPSFIRIACGWSYEMLLWYNDLKIASNLVLTTELKK